MPQSAPADGTWPLKYARHPLFSAASSVERVPLLALSRINFKNHDTEKIWAKHQASISRRCRHAPPRATAAPAPAAVFSSANHTTHRRRELCSGLTLETYYPASTYETFGEGIDHPLRKRTEMSLLESVAAFLQDKLRLKAENTVFHAGFSGAHARHTYAKQSHEGIFFANDVANVAFNGADKVVAFGSSFVNHCGALVHAFQVRDEAAETWYEALIDAHDGKLLSVVDYVSKASYRVISIKKQSVPDGFETLRDPSDRAASPRGWHSTPFGDSTTTSGNNAVSYKGGPKLGDASKKPIVPANVAAAIVNNFYIITIVRDIAYRYSIISTFIVMFLWNSTKPRRDGAFEKDIVVHEIMHGITNRLTGSGTAECLQSLEADGIGERWTEQKSAKVVDFTTGAYLVNNPAGIRSFPYSTSKCVFASAVSEVNPVTYTVVRILDVVQAIGEVWANILHNVYAALVNAHGWSARAFTHPRTVMAMSSTCTSLSTRSRCSPANPLCTLTARDAIIQADHNRYGGANKCLLWTAFVSRGVGVKAKTHKDDASVPAHC
ncbi:Fungalysin metallopeptidase-domain-containing protein [Mycena rebaudengoi]|nr:Fungalysin metallopeptidase-domain-containing protein [Mycena rebaudengoi]